MLDLHRMNTPLCIDLDGTLIKSDLLFETFLLLIKKNPLYLFACIYWLLKNKAYLKNQIAKRVEINPAILPYSENFLSYLKGEKSKGRYLVLVTASDYQLANLIADHIGIFSEVIASKGLHNVNGKNKRAILNEKFGEKQYDYAGNDKRDLFVWKTARKAIIVNAKSRIIKLSKKIAAVETIFSDRKNTLKNYLKLIRIHQFVKNLLVFVPIIVGHLYFNLHAILNSFLAFFIFCCLASSVYIVNDLLDLSADRQHKTKCHRAFAAGDISISIGLISAPLFLVIACMLSLLLPRVFFIAIASYYILTMFYSFYLKKKILVDIFTLAILYTVRIIAGIAAIGSNYSAWLITFSVFLFLSLAFVKRFSELENLCRDNKPQILGRGYLVSDLSQLQLFGTISGYLSVLVLALYINSDEVTTLYRYSGFLWLICLILLYWISRIWMLAARNLLHEDPVLFALKDKVSWVLIIFVGITIIGTSL